MIRTDRFLLRRFAPEDVPAFAAMNLDPVVMEHFPALLSGEETAALVGRLERHWDAHGFGPFAVELEGRFVGFVGILEPAGPMPVRSLREPVVEVGWRLAREAWGRGIATEAARLALRWGFEDLGLPEICSWTVPANVRSRRVMEKVGLVRDPAGDFEHPRLPEGHRLRPHVLYRAERGAWLAAPR